MGVGASCRREVIETLPFLSPIMFKFLIDGFTYTRAFLALPFLLILSIYARRALLHYRLKKLGHIAPLVPIYLPFGLDFIYKGVTWNRRHKSLELWDWFFNATGGKKRGICTVEVRVMGNIRVIFTADPENIKAVLTSQFADYGKGKFFHDEW